MPWLAGELKMEGSSLSPPWRKPELREPRSEVPSGSPEGEEDTPSRGGTSLKGQLLLGEGLKEGSWGQRRWRRVSGRRQQPGRWGQTGDREPPWLGAAQGGLGEQALSPAAPVDHGLGSLCPGQPSSSDVPQWA